MRFAWLKENSSEMAAVQHTFSPPLSLVHTMYNLVFWVFLLPFFTRMAYGSGFILFSIVITIRLALNLYTNNMLKPTPEQYEAFPFRIP
ncbi:MAG: hypothetical protein PVF18_11725 [Anaerolineales bacterium]|jgi:hypothetical protein